MWILILFFEAPEATSRVAPLKSDPVHVYQLYSLNGIHKVNIQLFLKHTRIFPISVQPERQSTYLQKQEGRKSVEMVTFIICIREVSVSNLVSCASWFFCPCKQKCRESTTTGQGLVPSKFFSIHYSPSHHTVRSYIISSILTAS
jgi:hypothetical protein